MKFSNNKITYLLLLVTLFFIESCASSGGLGSETQSVKEYSENFSKMKTIVRDAITGSNLNIHAVLDDQPEKLVLVVNQSRYVQGGGETAQREEGRVEVTKIDDNLTRVEIENPDYHFSVPTHQRENYQRQIFTRIDEKLGIES